MKMVSLSKCLRLRVQEIELPAPYGKTTQYIIPHSETITLAKALENKGVKLIETRGTWPGQKYAARTCIV